jgi:hypothetical protein
MSGATAADCSTVSLAGAHSMTMDTAIPTDPRREDMGPPCEEIDRLTE